MYVDVSLVDEVPLLIQWPEVSTINSPYMKIQSDSNHLVVD